MSQTTKPSRGAADESYLRTPEGRRKLNQVRNDIDVLQLKYALGDLQALYRDFDRRRSEALAKLQEHIASLAARLGVSIDN